jgi:MOSC domain-containing protein YiiM
VLTAIIKQPVEGRLRVSKLNVEGDQQADLRVHGGFSKAVYAYPYEHYPLWTAELGRTSLPFGMFGENLTTEGWVESAICIGDRFRVGTVIFQVSQPRMPCFKLALKFARTDMVKLFWASGRSGFYLSVVEEGELAAGDTMERIHEHELRVSVADVVRLYRDPLPPGTEVERAIASPLAGSWKTELRERLSS